MVMMDLRGAWSTYVRDETRTRTTPMSDGDPHSAARHSSSSQAPHSGAELKHDAQSMAVGHVCESQEDF